MIEPSKTTAEPLFIHGSRGAIFGWLHAPSSYERRAAAIVLCPPLGYEYVCAHHSFRELAVQLADAGFFVFRFDYYGTGDSSGRWDEPGQVAAWMDSIDAAIDEVKTISRCRQVSVAGLRLGGTLALMSAEARTDIDSVVLWCACPSGRSYARDIKMLSATLAQAEPVSVVAPSYPGFDPSAVEAVGFALSGATIEDLNQLKPDEISRCSAERVLMIERNDLKPNDQLARCIAGTGTTVDRVMLPGYQEMMVMPLDSVTPQGMLSAISGWLDSRYPIVREPSLMTRIPASAASALVMVDATRSVREEPVRFGPSGMLFGMMVEPAKSMDDERLPAVLLLNTGGDHHIGPHRLYVPLARELATLGFSVLRMDLDGLGDSGPAPAGPRSEGYPVTALRDLAEGLRFLQTVKGKSRVVAGGMCSGAFHVLRAAREGMSLDGVVAINAPLYYHTGDPFGVAAAQELEARRLRLTVSSPAGWAKVITGKTDFRYNVRAVTRYAMKYAKHSIADIVATATRKGSADSDPMLPSCDTFLIYSRTDAGLFFLETQGATQLRRHRRRKNFRMTVVEGPDHTFRDLRWQRHLANLVTEYLTDRYL
ncbi:MAG: alpha/beta fold hydrolase [Gemmatimonadaceae bacterium]